MLDRLQKPKLALTLIREITIRTDHARVDDEVSATAELLGRWELITSTIIGWTFRVKVILQDIRWLLPIKVCKALNLDNTTLTLTSPYSLRLTFSASIKINAEVLKKIDVLPVIPREIEDFLVIRARNGGNG